MKSRYTNNLNDSCRGPLPGRERRRVGEQKLSRLKEQLLKPALLNARDKNQRALLRLAASEAAALAWSTGYGLLFLPAVIALYLWEGIPRSLSVLQPLILLLLVAGSRTLA